MGRSRIFAGEADEGMYPLGTPLNSDPSPLLFCISMTDNPGVTLSTHLSRSWTNSPAWTLLEQAHDGRTLLVLTGGADETYIVDEAASDACVHRVFDAWQSDRLSSLVDDPECGAAVRQIQRVGALVPAQMMDRIRRFSVSWLGMACPALIPALQVMLAEHHGTDGMLQYGDDANDADMVLVVRTNASWQAVRDDYAVLGIRKPHLFVDLAYHHTVGIGPYVVPGETACVTCLSHRVAHRWGDLSGPLRPVVSSRSHAVAALLSPMLTAPDGVWPFLEHSISLNLQTLSSTRDKVFQLPWCEVCASQHDSHTGALPLPWQSAASESLSETLSEPAGR